MINIPRPRLIDPPPDSSMIAKMGNLYYCLTHNMAMTGEHITKIERVRVCKRCRQPVTDITNSPAGIALRQLLGRKP